MKTNYHKLDVFYFKTKFVNFIKCSKFSSMVFSIEILQHKMNSEFQTPWEKNIKKTLHLKEKGYS